MPQWVKIKGKGIAGGSMPGTRGSKIVYCPELCPGRYVHFSWLNGSFKLRNFIDGQMLQQDSEWDAHRVWDHCKEIIPADRVSVKEDIFWVQRLTEITREKLGRV